METQGCFPIGSAALAGFASVATSFVDLAEQFEITCKASDLLDPAPGSPAFVLRAGLARIHKQGCPELLCKEHHAAYGYIAQAIWAAFHETQHSLYALAATLNAAAHTGTTWEAIGRTSIEAAAHLCWLLPTDSDPDFRYGDTALRSAASHYRALLQREAFGDSGSGGSEQVRGRFRNVAIALTKENPATPPSVPAVTASIAFFGRHSQRRLMSATTTSPAKRGAAAIEQIRSEGVAIGPFLSGEHVYASLSATSHASLHRYLSWREPSGPVGGEPQLPSAIESEVGPLFAVISGLGLSGLRRYQHFIAGI